jgi:aconitate hydratase
VTVASLAGKAVDQVCVGSCTNSSYRDLEAVAHILKGRTVHRRVSLGLAPGSRQVLQMIAKDGALAALLAAGARLYENACGFCIGNSASPGTNAVSVRTSNRNFEGRTGTPSAGVYLTSPETAAVAAWKGEFADPRDCGIEPPRIAMPDRFDIDDSMFLRPPPDGSKVEVARGPNIGSVPRNSPLPPSLKGQVAVKVGDNITTDHIMPAGRRLKYRSNIAKYSTFVFEDVDGAFAGRAADNRDRGIHNVIVAGESYGQGSSREHAALCPMYLGVKAVIAKSIERIHKANLVNFGIMPFLFEKAADYDLLTAGGAVEIPNLREAAESGKAVLTANGRGIRLRLELSQREKGMLLAGGLLNTAGKGN